jgi:hypothetical protein
MLPLPRNYHFKPLSEHTNPPNLSSNLLDAFNGECSYLFVSLR